MKQKNYAPLIWMLTIAINGLIATAYFLPKIDSLKVYDLSRLPLLNAIFNGSTFIALLAALISIKRKKINAHRSFIFLAFLFTSLFLFSYLLYHFSTPSTSFGGTGMIKTIYFLILITHMFLAALIVPLALVTMSYGLTGNLSKHRKLAAWAMPIWLYVSLTGVIVYFLISPYYPH
jgi:putative membrane protein